MAFSRLEPPEGPFPDLLAEVQRVIEVFLPAFS